MKSGDKVDSMKAAMIWLRSSTGSLAKPARSDDPERSLTVLVASRGFWILIVGLRCGSAE